MKRISRFLVATLGVSLLAACAPVQRVILLPESNGRATAVEVSSHNQLKVLSKPYQAAVIGKTGELQVVNVTPLEVMDKYGSLLSLQPMAEKRYVLYFESGGILLTPESQAQLVDVLRGARARPGGEIIIVGHTDTVGTLEANDALSLQRASAIRNQLLLSGFAENRVDAVGRGEREPLVPTADEVNEPRNRRTDVIVR